MSLIATSLPLAETITPASQSEAAETIARASTAKTPVYTIGGGTGLSFGLTARREGWGLATSGLKRIVDYPHRDMTITVEAGLSMRALADELARHGQRLPIDAPQADEATIGGVVASNASGPRRFGHGTIRDYVIGISAIDGRGVPFKAGGRVVKNVAGYDFCKLLTGSRGSLAVITQVTLKLRPVAEATALVACDVQHLADAEPLLAQLLRSSVTPTAVELLSGPEWEHDPALGSISSPMRARLVVGVEGTQAEVTWMTDQLLTEWRNAGVRDARVIDGVPAVQLWSRLVESPAVPGRALVVHASMLPSAVTRFIDDALALVPDCSIQAHAGNGVLVVRLPEFSAGDALRVLVRGLAPAAIKAGGRASVYACVQGTELTHQAVWGPLSDEADVMRRVKSRFDPQGILNPGLNAFEC